LSVLFDLHQSLKAADGAEVTLVLAEEGFHDTARPEKNLIS
jgi:hypothetical protein